MELLLTWLRHTATTEKASFAPAGLSPVNVGRMLMRGRLSAFKPCPALACIELLQRSQLPIRNKKVKLCPCPLPVSTMAECIDMAADTPPLRCLSQQELLPVLLHRKL